MSDLQLKTKRTEIEIVKRQIDRQRRDIASLKRARIPSESAERLLDRMIARATALRRERDDIKKSAPSVNRGRGVGLRVG